VKIDLGLFLINIYAFWHTGKNLFFLLSRSGVKAFSNALESVLCIVFKCVIHFIEIPHLKESWLRVLCAWTKDVKRKFEMKRR